MKVPFPETFVARYREILGAELEPFLEALQRPLRKAIRVNRLKVDLSAFLRRMRAKGWQLEPVPWARGGFWVERPERERPLGHEVEHIAGLFYVQEAASMVPAAALEVEPGMLVLDLAAAPGGKSLGTGTSTGGANWAAKDTLSACQKPLRRSPEPRLSCVRPVMRARIYPVPQNTTARLRNRAS